MQAEGSRQREVDYQNVFQQLFLFQFYVRSIMDFSDIAILCNRPNNCCQQNLK